METRLQQKLEDGLRAVLAAELDRAIACVQDEDYRPGEPPLDIMEALKEFAISEAVGPLAREAFRALHIPRNALRVEATLEANGIGFKDANITLRMLAHDTAQNILDIRSMRGQPVEIIGSQLELEHNPELDGLDTMIQQGELALDGTPEPEPAVDAQPLYRVLDPIGDAHTEQAVPWETGEAMIAGLGGSFDDGWSLVECEHGAPAAEAEFPPETADSAPESEPGQDDDADTEPPWTGDDDRAQFPTLSDEQRIAAAVLRDGGDPGYAAEQAGVAKKTVARWTKDSEFARACVPQT